MIISTALTIQPKTAIAAAVRQEVGLAKGTLSRVRFDVPPGPNGEVYVRILHLENSIVPDMVDEWIPLLGGVLEFSPGFREWKGIYKVELEGCSPGARYAHTIEVLFEVDEQPNLSDVLREFVRLAY